MKLVVVPPEPEMVLQNKDIYFTDTIVNAETLLAAAQKLWAAQCFGSATLQRQQAIRDLVLKAVEVLLELDEALEANV